MDVSQNPILSKLDCSGNEIPQLDVMNNPQLTLLDCSSNQIGSLNLSKNTLLTTVNCSSNQLQGLIVRNNVALVDLNCSNNQLTVLDVTKNTELEKLNCSNNNLSTLDLRQNTKLTSLDCSGNESLIGTINVTTTFTVNNVTKPILAELIDTDGNRHYCVGDYYHENDNKGIVFIIDNNFGTSGKSISSTSVLKTAKELSQYSKEEFRDIFLKIQSIKDEINISIKKIGGEILSGEYSMYSIADYYADLEGDWRYKVYKIKMDTGATFVDIIVPAKTLERTLDIYNF